VPSRFFNIIPKPWREEKYISLGSVFTQREVLKYIVCTYIHQPFPILYPTPSADSDRQVRAVATRSVDGGEDEVLDTITANLGTPYIKSIMTL